MHAPHKKIFLSHSSADAALATELRNLLIIGCGVSTNDILVSSVPGNGIPAGTPSFVDYLKERIQNAEIVVLLLSENFFASQYCLCELGATWTLGKPYFPMVVPPLSKSELGSTLEVAQAGEINNGRYLDQLPDKIRAMVGTGVRTDAWGLQRDVFLAGLGGLIKALPAPKLVSANKLVEAQNKYHGAIAKIGEKEKEAVVLKQQIADLEKCKDKDEANAVARKYSSADEEFERLCDTAKEALDSLKRATCIALYWEGRGDIYMPDGQDEWGDVRQAEAVEQLDAPEGANYCSALDLHPVVEQAKNAIHALKEFLKEENREGYVADLTRVNKFPTSLRNKDFWHKYLTSV